MAISYDVRAEITDITADIPRADDAFMVDTNVWYWLTYPKALSLSPKQLSAYSAYLNKAFSANSRVYYSGLTLAELSHIIEKTEREIYERTTRNNVKPKEFRHNLSGQRTRVVAEIRTVWGQVTQLAESLAITIDDQTVNAALKRLQTEKVDGYDLFILESMKNHGVMQIITDDGDFATVSGIQMFTANRNVIQTAKVQGRLLTR